MTATSTRTTTATAIPTQPASIPVPNQYIVVFKRTAQTAILNGHENWLNRTAAIGSPFAPRFSRLDGFSYPNITAFPSYSLLHKYNNSVSGFKGYAAKISADIAASLRTLPEVESVQQDSIVSYVRPTFRAKAVQTSGAPWGLRRISKGSLPLPASYTYPDEAGAGVDVYVVDTGVDVGNPEFEGRARIGVSYSTDRNDIDGDGHGSHVAGTVASKTYGVAKRANIIAVKVLASDGTGYNSDVIAGINWVVQQAASTRRKSVINMSLGGGRNSAVDSAVAAAVRAGVTTVVAAGNENVDACTTSPAAAPEAITVAASSSTDYRADFSNWGSCVDVIAPGVSVQSIDNNRGLMSISGTSMASPHVAGVVAVAMSTGRVTTPADANSFLRTFGASNMIWDVKGTVNLLLQIGPVTTATTTTTTTTTTTRTTTAPAPTYTCTCPATHQGSSLSLRLTSAPSSPSSIPLVNSASTAVDAMVSILGSRGSDSFWTLQPATSDTWGRVAGVSEWVVFRRPANGSTPERRIGIFVSPGTQVEFTGFQTAAGVQEYPDTAGKLIVSETSQKDHITVVNESGLDVTVQVTSYTGGSSSVFNLDRAQTGVWGRTGWEGVVIRDRNGSGVVSIYTMAGTVLTLRRF
ncbi:serine protease [Chytridiales sp. JEL 0842]|nr:serine protease [Chytridiales sp. JEL 0842]